MSPALEGRFFTTSANNLLLALERPVKGAPPPAHSGCYSAEPILPLEASLESSSSMTFTMGHTHYPVHRGWEHHRLKLNSEIHRCVISGSDTWDSSP